MKTHVLLLVLLVIFSCTKEEQEKTDIPYQEMYFPSNTSTNWENISLKSAGFNEEEIEELLSFLEDTHTKGFIVLKNGRIVIESYFNGHSINTNHYWASAAKVLTAAVVGIAQEAGHLNINDTSSEYLGDAWTNTFPEQESLITIKHQLSMTTGLDETNFGCTDADCLNYVADAGTRWAYHNGPYTLLQQVVENACGENFRTYFNTKLRTPIGMNGYWYSFGDYEIYTSNTRSMARFGLLALNNYKWNKTPIISDSSYISSLKSSSQDLNKSYGYLWWLNGKSSYRLPGTTIEYEGSLIPNAPEDMYMAIGKNDQRIYILPSSQIVVVRMGDQAYESSLALSEFDINLWEKLNTVINN